MPPAQLGEVSEKVKSGQFPDATVRTLLSWYDAYRRSWRNVKRIRGDLDALGLVTFPDFEGEYIDGIIIFKPKQIAALDSSSSSGTCQGERTAAVNIAEAGPLVDAGTSPVGPAAQLADPAHRISRLGSANKPPVSVSPDAKLEEAVTLMLRYEYSQLPVMQSPRDVKGIISWNSLGARLALGRPCEHVRDCMDKHQEISLAASLFDAVQIIAEHDCVLVRAADNTICGIVTGYDISLQFQQLAEPFLLLGDIENHVRYLITAHFGVADLQLAKDSTDNERTIEDVSDLTFGEYVRLLQREENWSKLGMRLCGKTFIKWLDKVRQIRNDVMHFDPDPIEPEDLKLLKEFARLLDRWQQLSSTKT